MKYWTTKEISYIQKNALLAETNEVINVEDMAKKLGRSVAAVSKKIYELRRDGALPKTKRELAFDSKGRPWTVGEEKRLIAMYKQGCSYADIAEALGRSESSCSTKASKLQSIGKIKSKRLAHWTDQEVALILDKVEFDANGYVSNYSELSTTTEPNFDREAVDYSGIPQNLVDLMKANNVIPAEIMAATESKGYYPTGTPIQNYDPGYIDGVLVAAWPQVFTMIQEIRKQQKF